MKSLKEFIEKAYYGKANKNLAYCEQEKSIYTATIIKSRNCNFMFVCEYLGTEELLKCAIAYNEYYYALVYVEDFETVEIRAIFEGLYFEELSYESFLNELQEEQEEIKLALLEDDDFLNWEGYYEK